MPAIRKKAAAKKVAAKKPTKKKTPAQQVNSETLTAQQRAFVDYLLTSPTWDKTAAARQAGYSHPAISASKLMKNPIVAKLLEREQKARNEAVKMTATDLLRELSYVALRDPIDLVDDEGFVNMSDLRKIPERTRRCIEGMEVTELTDSEGNVCGQKVKLKFAPKTPAIELAMKHFGMMAPEKKDVKVSVNWDEMYASQGRRMDARQGVMVDPIEVEILKVEQL